MKLQSFIALASPLLLGYQAFVAYATNDTSPANSAATYFDNDVYSSWLQGSSSKYEHSTLMSSLSNSSVGLFWSIDSTNKMIQLAVVCPMGSGWCGFGLAEAGGMKGADMIIYESESNDLYDAYVLDDINGGPVRDECQNWKLVNSIASDQVTQTKSLTGDDGVIIFEATRALDTNDTFDKAFIDDSDFTVPATRVIAAWGNTATVSYHGQNRLRDSIRFFRYGNLDEESMFQKAMNESADGMIELKAINYTIPTNETTYAHFCWTYSDLVRLGLPEGADLHSIGFEPIVDEDSKPYVHHFVLAGTADPYTENVTSPVSQEVCENSFQATEMAYVWAPGEEPFVLPSFLGGPLGVNGFQSFRLEIHYNNPTAVPNVTDSSGIRLYWTNKKREMDLGILQLGDPTIYLYSLPVGNGLSKHTFDCPESCSSAAMTQNVTVIREYLHMHRTGVRQTNEVLRDGEVVHTAFVDFFDFSQQGNIATQQSEYQIQPGDSFQTTCYYSANDEVWGLGSQQEMCISFLYYYPRQIVNLSGVELPFFCGVGLDYFPPCNSTYESAMLSSPMDLNRVFGSDEGSCPSTVADDSSSNHSTPTGSQNTTSAAISTVAFYWSYGWHLFLFGMIALSI